MSLLQVGRVVDRVAGTRKEVISRMEYVLNSTALHRLCARGKSVRCHCQYHWD